MRKKTFWGYNSREDAEKFWGHLLDDGIVTTKEIAVVDDATKWPQTSSKTITVTTIELSHDVISY